MVPATSCTTDRSSPASRFSSELLPTFGLPTSATRRGPPPPDADLGHRGQRIDDLVQQIGHPAAVHRADRVRLPQPQRPQRRGIGLAALGVNLVGRQEHWLARPLQQPRRRLVGRRRPHRRVDDEDDRVRGAHRHRRLLGHQLLQTLCVGLPAAGVLHDEPPPRPQFASYDTRSRVTPGTSCTTASRRPRIRFTNVDLPTFGRPTTATTGGGAAASSIASATSSAPSSQSLSSAQVPRSELIATPRHAA